MRRIDFAMNFRSRASWCAVMAAALTLFANASWAAAAELVPVTLRVDVFFYGSHVPLLAGIADGTYEKHGLKVTAQPGRGSATTIQTVANRSDDFGFADSGTLVRLATQGLRAKVVIGMLQKSPMIIMTKQASGLKTPRDLNGRTGGFTPGSAPEQILPALAGKTGIDLNSIKKVSADIPTRDNIFLAGQTDFSFGYTTAQLPLLQERCKCELNVIRYSDYGITALSNGIVVSDSMLAEKPDVVRRFVAATVESIAKAVKDPQTAVDGFFKYAEGKTQLSRNVVTTQWAETIKILKTDASQNMGYGQMAESDWKETIDLLVRYADLPEGKVTPAMVYTNRFLSK
jgi:NitT/TauT family transport system substrate-binding protein